MGQLVPDDFDYRQLRNDAERDVVRELCRQLGDGWFVIPNVRIMSNHKDYELDVIVMHTDYGIADIEVKGHHRATVRNGKWFANDQMMKPQPFSQASDNAHQLKRNLQDSYPGLFDRLYVSHAVAFPNMNRLSDTESLEFRREQLILKPDFEDLRAAVHRIFDVHNGQLFPTGGIQAALETICPSIDFEYDPAASAKRMHARLEEICDAQVKTMITLFDNRRVAISGKAGTGKTRLAIRWVSEAVGRDERVLFACFNEPLALEVQRRVGQQWGDDVVAGAFLKIAQTLPGMPPIKEPDEMTDEERQRFWNIDMLGHLHSNWPDIELRFDTIVVDEAQDFSPAWIALLEALLDPSGPRRMLLVGDPDQDVFGRGFRMPTSADGWTTGELVTNCRNSYHIARLLRFVLAGAAAPQTLPEGSDLTFFRVSDADSETVDVVRRALAECHGPDIAVVVGSRKWRDLLRQGLGFGSYEDRETMIPCETEKRLKGTEFSNVILVDPEGRMSRQALYIGISRAVNKLIIVGPESLRDQLKIEVSR